MGIFSYALFAYGLTAVISLIITGIIVLVNKVTKEKEEETEESAE
jgi:hypothetical protein